MKRLSYFSIAQSNLKNRKKSYILLSFGIILSMIFSSGLIFFMGSYKYSKIENMYIAYGKHNALIISSEDKTEDLSHYTDKAVSTEIPAFFYTENSEELNGFAAQYLNEAAAEIAYPIIKSGRLPECAGEIAVEHTALSMLDIENVNIGEKITFIEKIPDGRGFTDEVQKKTFILTGILHDKKSNIVSGYVSREDTLYYPAAYLSSEEKTEGVPLIATYIVSDNLKWHNDISSSENTVKIYFNNNDIRLVSLDNFYNYIYLMISCVLLAFISGIGIANAFSSNLKSRKKQIGLLRGIGATKRQIVSVYGRETFIISLICVPFSILISYVLTKLIIKNLGGDSVFIPDMKLLFTGAVFSLLYIWVVSLFPLISASSVSPVQAMGNIEMNRKMYRKKIKSEKDFVLSSLYAKRSFIFAGAKRAGISIILTLTILISCFGFSLAYENYKNAEFSGNDYSIESIGDISVFRNTVNFGSDKENKFTQTDFNSISANPYVKSVQGIKNCYANILKDELTDFDIAAGIGFNGYSVFDTLSAEGITKDNYKDIIKNNINEDYLGLKNRAGYENYYLQVIITAHTEGNIKNIEKYITDGKINIDKLDSGEEVLILAKEKSSICIIEENGEKVIASTSYDSKKYEYLETQKNPVKAGDKLNLSVLYSDNSEDYNNGVEFSEKRHETCIGAVLTDNNNEIDIMNGWYQRYPIVIITTVEGMKHFSEDELYTKFSVYLKDKANAESDESVTGILKKISDKKQGSRVFSKYQNSENIKQRVKSDVFALTALVILFFTLCGSMVNNSVASKIAENKKQIGTMRAVGADERELGRCFSRQILSIFLWGGISGFGGYIIINTILRLLISGFAGIKYIMLPSFIAFVLLFLICYINLKIKIRKEMKNSIVDNIREL